MIKNKIYRMVLFVVVAFIIISLISLPDICSQAVSRAFLICGNVIIPSLFPFMVCVLLIMQLGVRIKNRFILRIVYYVFGQNADMFTVFLFSMIGGYPIGCKLLNELYEQNKINIKAANIMQMYCVNAGPAFIITAVGTGVFSSKKIGIILFVSHITASVLIAALASKSIKKYFEYTKVEYKSISLSESFVECVSDAAKSIISICTYVIIFSVLNSYIAYFFEDVSILKNISYFTEVTIGLGSTNNIIFASYLLGFSGFSIWFQLFSLSKKAKINLKLFISGRLMHSGISCVLTFILINILKISKTAFNNNMINEQKIFYNNFAVSFSLGVMLIVLLIYFFSKNNSRKLINDMI